MAAAGIKPLPLCARSRSPASDAPTTNRTARADRDHQSDIADIDRHTCAANRDRDGNLSTFRFDTFELLDDDTLFTPPATLIWKEP